MFEGLFVDPIHFNTEPMLIHQTDGITGGSLATPEMLYGVTQQQMVGWPGLHLYPWLHRDDWSPDAARAFYAWWLPRSLPWGCDCGSHYSHMAKAEPMRFDTPDEFFRIGHAWHNTVSARIDRDGSHPQLPLDHARSLWSRIAAAWPVAWWRSMPTQPREPGRRLLITVAAGPAREWLRISEPSLRAYANRCDAEFVALTGTMQSWWGLEKFRVWDVARHFDQTLFVDADVLIGPGVPNLFEIFDQFDIAMHNDWPHLPSTDWIAAERQNVAECQDDRAFYDGIRSCLNSGVVYTSKRGSEIWRPPKLPLPTTHCAEQFLLEWRTWDAWGDDLQIGDSAFDTRWNLQWWMPNFERDIASDCIVHFANAPNKADTMRVFQMDPRLSLT